MYQQATAKKCAQYWCNHMKDGKNTIKIKVTIQDAAQKRKLTIKLLFNVNCGNLFALQCDSSVSFTKRSNQ